MQSRRDRTVAYPRAIWPAELLAAGASAWAVGLAAGPTRPVSSRLGTVPAPSGQLSLLASLCGLPADVLWLKRGSRAATGAVQMYGLSMLRRRAVAIFLASSAGGQMPAHCSTAVGVASHEGRPLLGRRPSF